MAAIPAQQREHFWDAVRAFLMLLGIPYHTALSYQGQDWIVRSGQGAAAFRYLAEFIHLFRMPAFFVIAGYFAALLLSRRAPGDWLRGRFGRLGVPFVATLVTLVPLMNLACELSNLPPHAALASWRHESLTSAGYWIRHLWFILVLLYCSAAAALLVRCFPRLRTARLAPRADRRAAAHFAPWLLAAAVLMGLWQAAAIELFYIAGLATNVPQQFLRLDELIACAPWFALGCLIARAPQLRERLLRFSPAIAAAALAATFASLWLLGTLSPPTGRFVATIAAVGLTQTLFAAARHIADKPHALVRAFVDGAFVIYLVHMPVIVGLVLLGQAIALPVFVKAPMVMLLALALSWGAWRVVARSPTLALLFNGERLPRPTRLRPA